MAAYNRKRQQAKRDGTWVPGRPVYEKKKCTGPGCERIARHLTPQPLCGAHYLQIFRKVPLSPIRRTRRVRDGLKECNRCGEVLAVTEYNKQSDNRIQSSCKRCQSITNRAQRYGWAFDDMKALVDQPCAGCGSEVNLHVDHCHDTGKVRGVLCRSCNTVLMKHMTPEILRRLADYLEASAT